MRTIAAIAAAALLTAAVCTGRCLAAERLHLAPALPRSPAALLDLLSSPRSDVRNAAFGALSRMRRLSPRMIERRIESAPACARPFLYDLASLFGDERTMETLIARYDPARRRDYEYVRLMENILVLGAEYPLPQDFMRHALLAWLEGDEALSEAAERAVLKAGEKAVPQLVWQYYSADEGRRYSALAMLVKMRRLPPPLAALRDFPRGEAGAAALDAVTAVQRRPEAALFALEKKLGSTVERRALWWLAALFPERLTAAVLDRFAAEGGGLKVERAYLARVLLRLCRPDVWRKREQAMRARPAGLSRFEAALLLYCADSDSLRTLFEARCEPDAEALKARWLSSFCGFERLPMFAAPRYEIALKLEGLPSLEDAGALGMTGIVAPLLNAGRREEAARVLSRSLTLCWDPGTAGDLMLLMAEDPSLPRSLYLRPFEKWFTPGSRVVREADIRFARALLGSEADMPAVSQFIERAGAKNLLRRRMTY